MTAETSITGSPGPRGRHACGRARLPGPLRVRARPQPRPGPRPHHRRRQRRLPRGHHDQAGRHHRPPAVRRLPRQPRRPGQRRRAQPEGVPHPRPARAGGRRHVGAEVRHPATRIRGRWLRGALLEPVQLAGARSRRLGDLRHPPGPGHHRIRPLAPRRRLARGIEPRRHGGRNLQPGPGGGRLRPRSSRRPTRSWRCSTPARRSSIGSRPTSSPT